MTIVTLISGNEWVNFTETGQPPLDRIDAFLARGIQTEP